MFFQIRSWLGLGLGIVCLADVAPGVGAESRVAGPDLEFFEKKVRPILVERCYRCHSAEADKVRGGLRLDSAEALWKGGDSGPAVVPGDPTRSRLIEAVTYTNPDLQMPPKGKLSDQDIADLRSWVSLGAPWPSETPQASGRRQADFDLEARRQRHWAWKPIEEPDLPTVPEGAWAGNPVDRFILAKLQEKGLAHADRADGRTLLRRLSFDLVGLPPSPEAMRSWLGPDEERSYDQAVEELLASPHFGERWARHWLDLVRYAETLGHEFDYTNPNAWRYRDYIVRAFNADVPYDQFVREHIAGDLLPSPRRHPVQGFNESAIGPAFYWLGQRDHSPVDVRQHQAELIDNQIDVLSKTFLGLTVSCARCHDHKFDAIPTADYYALYGMLSSSRYTQARIDRPEAVQKAITSLDRARLTLRQALADTWSGQASQIEQYVHAVDQLTQLQPSSFDSETMDDLARELNLDPLQIERWLDAIGTIRSCPQTAASSLPSPKSNEASSVTFVDFGRGSLPEGWLLEGEAFQLGVSFAGSLLVGIGPSGLSMLETPALHSGQRSRQLQGVARSPTFEIRHRYIHILAAGQDARINVPIANFTMIRDPIYGGLKRILRHDQFRWLTIDVGMWQGQRAFLEFSDVAVPDPADDARPTGFDASGYLAVRQIVFSEQGSPPPTPPAGPPELTPDVPTLRQEGSSGLELQCAVTRAVQRWKNPTTPGLELPDAQLLGWMLDHRLLTLDGNTQAEAALAEFRQTEGALPSPIRVPSMVDGTGLDEPVFVRGNHRLPGPNAPRRFLQAIAGPDQTPITRGSGRLELAERMLDARNPFTARVLVNRVWLHLFGRGLVPTPDDFGELGQRPTHPELLDWLAHWFRTEGEWSIKRLVRLLVTSRTYQMASTLADPAVERQDPGNFLWRRMNVRRLEGETIRDALLAMSGRLDLSMFGPPVPVHLTEFMEGRGRPNRSGPLDGAGRRSVYLEVRRNFISPMMRTFDMPVPFTTVGLRTVSNVPAQSLILMNDAFVLGEAQRWAERVLLEPGRSREQRIQEMYEAGFARPPSIPELEAALTFLDDQKKARAAQRTGTGPEIEAWTDLAHVLFNVKEFVFID